MVVCPRLARGGRDAFIVQPHRKRPCGLTSYVASHNQADHLGLGFTDGDLVGLVAVRPVPRHRWTAGRRHLLHLLRTRRLLVADSSAATAANTRDNSRPSPVPRLRPRSRQIPRAVRPRSQERPRTIPARSGGTSTGHGGSRAPRPGVHLRDRPTCARTLGVACPCTPTHRCPRTPRPPSNPADRTLTAVLALPIHPQPGPLLVRGDAGVDRC